MNPANKTKCRRIIFTHANYTDETVQYYENLAKDQFNYVMFGYEVAKSGLQHLQGFASFGKQLRFGRVKALMPGAHLTIPAGKLIIQKEGFVVLFPVLAALGAALACYRRSDSEPPVHAPYRYQQAMHRVLPEGRQLGGVR